jgi:hypothetical protein
VIAAASRFSPVSPDYGAWGITKTPGAHVALYPCELLVISKPFSAWQKNFVLVTISQCQLFLEYPSLCWAARDGGEGKRTGPLKLSPSGNPK